ncbi:unnamed protein product [Polarella glacialis]|uniref:C3H1-type domain-containing protein n=1 Tax=Polarella glacialis TaxID=89957 RepID=A0A813HR68_POLGL|nr:unnamed protein product [Polarella glacialis]
MSATTQPVMPAECKGAADGASVPGEGCPKQGSCLSDLPPTVQMDAHRLGVCVPCNYFALKKDGCCKGDDCTFCHFCSFDEAKSRMRQLRAEAKQSKATTRVGKQRGNHQAEAQKEFGMSRSAAALGLDFQPSAKVKNTSVHFLDVSEAPKGLSRGGSALILMSAMTQPVMQAECKGAADDASVPGEGCPKQGSVQMEAHRLGVCEPCTYFARKKDGCCKGDECTWCHFCSFDVAKARRRQLKNESKFRKRQLR